MPINMTQAGKGRKESREAIDILKAPLPAFFVLIFVKKAPCKNLIEDTLTARDAAHQAAVLELIQLHKRQILGWLLSPLSAQSAIPLDKGIAELWRCLCLPGTLIFRFSAHQAPALCSPWAPPSRGQRWVKPLSPLPKHTAVELHWLLTR